MISGSSIKWARLKKKLSQVELAERLGVTRNSILAWENDKSEISEENERRVREFFGSELQEAKVPPRVMETKSLSAGDLEELVRMLAGVQPDLVHQFRRVVKSMDKLSEDDAKFLAHMLSLSLGQICGRITSEDS